MLNVRLALVFVAVWLHSASDGQDVSTKYLRAAFKRSVEIQDEHAGDRCQDFDWVACGHDSAYYKADTVFLFQEALSQEVCCRRMRWSFRDGKTFTLIQDRHCQEPPISGVAFEDQRLVASLSKKNGGVVLRVIQGKVLRDEFRVIALEAVPDGSCNRQLHRLTLLRNKM